MNQLPEKYILWGLNQYGKRLVSQQVPLFIIDKYSKEKSYENIKIYNDLKDIPEASGLNCIICSPSHYGEIETEVLKSKKTLKPEYVGHYLDGLPLVEVCRNVSDLNKSKFVNILNWGEISIKGSLTIMLDFKVPVSISVEEGSTLILEDVTLMDGVEISVSKGGRVEIGKDTYINRYSVIRSAQAIHIGKKCAIAWNVSILDHDGHVILDERGMCKSGKVVINDHVWIGNGSNILANTVIEENSVVGCNSMVKGHFEKESFLAGTPAKIKRTNVNWK